MVFYTQITMEAAEDPEFLDGDAPGTNPWRARRRRVGHRRRAEGRLQELQRCGRSARRRGCRRSGTHGVHVLGSFIFGLPTDTPATFAATADLAQRAGVSFAQFVMLTAASRAPSISPSGRREATDAGT